MASDIKRPGKTEWAGRRRPATRESGFKATAPVRLRVAQHPVVLLEPDQCLSIEIAIHHSPRGSRVGFGGWLLAPKSVEAAIDGCPVVPVCKRFEPPSWGKFGAQWRSENHGNQISITIAAHERCRVGIWDLAAGQVTHDVYSTAEERHLDNISATVPEANFYVDNTATITWGPIMAESPESEAIYLKSCNRCGRFLPINFPAEREALSYSNHCVSGAPCTHTGFGLIEDSEDDRIRHKFHHGFQLECRFCKKFFVNLPLNPQRTPAQMKEDGARRRAFEVLLEQLYCGSPQLSYRERTGEELAQVVFERFGGRCFKCGIELDSPQAMHLDHTRPLALLWPLDEYATSLCADHNAEKRDRAPSEYYTDDELIRLSKVTRAPGRCLTRC